MRPSHFLLEMMLEEEEAGTDFFIKLVTPLVVEFRFRSRLEGLLDGK